MIHPNLKRLLLGLAFFGSTLFATNLPMVPSEIDHSLWDELLREFVDERGMVDYGRWHQSAEHREKLSRYVAQFAPEPEEPAVGDDKIAALINAYNAFTIDFILQNYPTESIMLLTNPWEGERHLLGGQKVSVDTVEHAMLRPIIGWEVHSVVVCAARSCPPLLNRAFLPETWRDQMEERYRAWFAREDLNAFDTDRFRRTVRISRIFQWYSDDYTGEHSVPEILRRFGPPEHADFLQGNFRIAYLPYHWGLNDQSDLGKSYRHNPLRRLFN
jgi:hypothetical protein